MSANDDLIQVCAWVRMRLPGMPTFIGFTYVDPEAGLSAKGGNSDNSNLGERPDTIIRLPIPGIACEVLTHEEIAGMGLPRMPAWVEHYGPQPLAGKIWGEWRRHPSLQGRFHPDFPDDLQVIVHDGGPRLTKRRPELAWVRVSQGNGEDDVFHGRLLSQPKQLETVSEGDEIQFVAPEGGEHPLMVTSKYLCERPDWVIGPCRKCGLTELFDAPSDLIRVVFPNIPPGAVLRAFTAFCGICGGAGVQLVRHKSAPPEIERPVPPADPAPAAVGVASDQPKSWWRFWS
jgi:hypothetical protein